MTIFAGKELSKNLSYLKQQGKEIDLKINYPRSLEPLVRLYISIFGIPEIGLQERFRVFQKLLKNLKPKIIVDAGCGSGIHTRLVSKEFPDSFIYALDIEDNLITINQKITLKKNINFIKFDLTKPFWPKVKHVDLLYSFDVLEHIKNYKKVLNNFSKVIKKGGHLILHVPLIKQKRWFGYFKNWEHDTHVREGFDEQQLLKQLKNLNFVIIKKQGTFGNFGSFFWEINTLLFKKVPFVAVLAFPIIRLLLPLDGFFKSKKYNCIGILAKKTL